MTYLPGYTAAGYSIQASLLRANPENKAGHVLRPALFGCGSRAGRASVRALVPVQKEAFVGLARLSAVEPIRSPRARGQTKAAGPRPA